MTSKHLLFVIFWMTISYTVSLTWSSSINGLFSARGLMSQTVGVSKDLVESIANGAQVAMDQCKTVFKWDRWNCPESAFSRRNQHSVTREQAVAHAIVSAGIVHTITRNCSRGQLKGCGCDSKLRGPMPTTSPYITETGIKLSPATYSKIKKTKVDWSWGGCSDDVEFGQAIAKTVLDDLERGKDQQAFANLHNNLVGRTIIRNTMVKRCRCHGVSGSCALQTCWLQVAPFSKIANMLRDRYKKAARIDVENRINNFPVRMTHTEMVDGMTPKLSSHRLVFIQDSPDYCRANSTTDWPGTKGRACSRSKSETASLLEKRSCRNLCRKCGYRVRKQKRQVTWNCNCKFEWCCAVRCDTCTEMVEEFFCE